MYMMQELKAIGDECCVALRYQLARDSYIYEEALAADGIALDNDDGKEFAHDIHCAYLPLT
jgi:hypothetical protein